VPDEGNQGKSAAAERSVPPASSGPPSRPESGDPSASARQPSPEAASSPAGQAEARQSEHRLEGQGFSPAGERQSGSSDVKVVDRRWWAQGDHRSATDGAEAPSLKPTYVEELERQLAEKDRLLQSYIERFKSASNEFDEARARLRREVARDVERGRRTVLAELLDVVDNLDRAIDAAREGTSADAVLQGVELVRKQFLTKLEAFQVRRVPSLGQRFDPAIHEAVSTVPTTNPDEDETVLGVVKEGYVIGDEILRPAMVAVGRVFLSPEAGSA
jgi:molecular chaperone GrpE